MRGGRTLDLGLRPSRSLGSGRKICVDLELMPQVVANYGICVVQPDGWILLDNLFRRRAVVERDNQGIKRNSRAAYAIYAVCVCGDRHRFRLDYQLHGSAAPG
jgi:hypothetical protein